MTWTLENKIRAMFDFTLSWKGNAMNAYDWFLSSLLSEFKSKAQPQVRSLWDDLMELEVPVDKQGFFAAHEQALRRIHVLGRAASVANAHQVHSLGQTLEFMLGAFTQAPAAARPELFESLYATMRELTGAVCSIDAEALVSAHTGRSTEMTLVESCAD
jgi:hypothetical protein